MWTTKLLIAAVLMIESLLVEAQVPFLGPCPDIEPMKNFDVNKYLGLWYEHKRYFAIFEAGGKCVTAQYGDNGNGTVSVINTEFNTMSKKFESIEGEARLTGNPGEGKLGVKFPSVGGFEAPYNVLGTDYTSYAVVWSCNDVLHLVNLQLAWMLTREKVPSEETLRKIQEVIDATNLSTRPFHTTLQDCDN